MFKPFNKWKNNNETRPLLEQLNELQAKNRKEMLKANQRIAEAETIIAESSRRRYYVENTLIEQQIDEEEEFYDALDTQEWLNVKNLFRIFFNLFLIKLIS
ncbi:MAG: hypothetical protein H9Q65_05075 [Spiroplasma ixodetis]|nr:hypothetical protein [Spiroplasma ixodetis]MBP1527362.1 hypothetical protein [Spiroplasma ixodetis]MBP1528597.1 hypothetical protein [Spiroplasma ixodetis]